MEGKQEPEQIKVVFYNVALTYNIEELRETLIDDPLLLKAILWYKEKLEKEGIEVWLQEKNMLVTESGYKVALTENQIEALTN